MSIYLFLLALALTIAAWLFEYSLYSITGRDVPWYLDLLGGCVLNGLNFPLAAICFILRMAGVTVPFYGG